MMKYRVARWEKLLPLGLIVGPAAGGAVYVFGMAVAAALRGYDIGRAVAFNVAIIGAVVGVLIGWVPALATVVVCCVLPRDRAFGYLRFLSSSVIAALIVLGQFDIFGNDRATGYVVIALASAFGGSLVWSIAREFNLIIPAS